MKFLDRLQLKFFIKLHNFLYYRISLTAIRLNNNLHPKHRILKYYQYFLDNIEENSNILDIGCGNGYVSYMISEKAKRVVAIDIDKENIQSAKKKYNRENIIYIVGDATKYNFEDKFDFIILSNVLEHIRDRTHFLNKIKRLSNNILIRVPMLNRGWLPLYKKELGLEYRLDISHYIEYTLEIFKKEIEKAGLKVISYEIQFGEIWAKISVNN